MRAGGDTPHASAAADNVVEMQHIATRFEAQVVHTDVNFSVRRAEVFALIGGSGSGKSTLLREMIALQRPNAGAVQVLGTDLTAVNAAAVAALRQRWGVLFQHGGLFESLTVLENVGLPMREHTGLPNALVDDIAAWKIAMTGLAPEVGAQHPSQLSGGMLKRASLARALALDPELLFLDEPTAGLDPVSASEVDALVLTLRGLFGLTVVMVTHDLDTLWQVADRVAVLADGVVKACGSMAELSQSTDPAVRPFFDGPRARNAAASARRSATAASAPHAPATATPPPTTPPQVAEEPPSKPK
jgi:phospholipid/cholesterol/gamma-HCH transport system ATP-binding protein